MHTYTHKHYHSFASLVCKLCVNKKKISSLILCTRFCADLGKLPPPLFLLRNVSRALRKNCILDINKLFKNHLQLSAKILKTSQKKVVLFHQMRPLGPTEDS